MNQLHLSTLCLCLCLGGALAAQDLIPKTHAQTHPVLIRGASIHPVSGPSIAEGQILFDRGRILAVASLDTKLQLPAKTQIVEAAGKHVYPGLISAVTTLGLIEISQVAATVDHSEVNPINPEVRAVVAINPDSTTLPVARAGGVLAAGVFPGGGMIHGRPGVIQLDGWTWEDMSLQPEAGMCISWPAERRSSRRRSGTSGREVRALRRHITETFAKAQAYLKARAADPEMAEDIRYEPFRAVLAAQAPLFVRADGREQIESVVSWAAGMGMKVVILGGRMAPECAALLAQHDVAVIALGTHRLPGRRDEAVDAPFTLPQRLQSKGLRWCLGSSGSFYQERNLPFHAATAAAHGLDPELALRSITLAAAQVLGVDRDLGSLEKGKLATLLLTDGNPLEITTRVEQAYISGRQIDLRSKQTQLHRKYVEKYRQLGILPR